MSFSMECVEGTLAAKHEGDKCHLILTCNGAYFPVWLTKSDIVFLVHELKKGLEAASLTEMTFSSFSSYPSGGRIINVGQGEDGLISISLGTDNPRKRQWTSVKCSDEMIQRVIRELPHPKECRWCKGTGTITLLRSSVPCECTGSQ